MRVVGVDIGGTSIKVGLVNETGLVLDTFTMPVDKSLSVMQTVNALNSALKTFINSVGDVDAVGVGCPGLINSTEGIVCSSNNLDWYDLPLKNLMETALKKPVKITNDANAAALGENKFGAGREYQNMVMITLGTGVGSGIIVNNQIFEGHEGKGAELGHMILQLNGRQCTCGRKGCFETYASATALINDTKQAIMEHPESSLANVSLNSVNGKTVFDHARNGDQTAMEVVEKYITYLGEGLLNIMNIFRPEAIVLSGGIANQGQFLVDMLDAYCKARNYGFKLAPKVDIKIAQIGYASGIIGAASLFL